MPEIFNNNRISLSTGTIIRFFLIGVLLLALYYLFDIVMVVLAAVVIASSIEPIVRRMKHYFHFHRIVSVIILFALILAMLAGILVFFMPLVVNDLINFLKSLPSTVSFETLWNPISDAGVGAGTVTQSLSAHTISIADLINNMQSVIIGTSAGAFRTASVLFGGALSFLLIVVLAFYFSVQQEGVDDFLRIVTPVKKHDYIIGLWKRSQRKIGLWLQGQVLLGIIVGILVYAVLMIVGIPYALALAVLAAIFEIAPVFGPIISSIPAILIAFAEKGVGTGFLLLGLYIIIYQVESQIFYPLVVRKVVGVNPIVVILALIIGAKLAGVLGAIIAVPLSAALLEYVSDVERRKKDEKEMPRTASMLKE